MDQIKTQRLVSRWLIGASGVGTLLVVGCATTHPAVTQQMADVEAATRSANELGAQTIPNAQLYLKLADEQLTQAKTAIANDDEMNASRLLMRAKADAELAVALTRSSSAKVQETKALAAKTAAGDPNVQPGATP